jgi:hypothetical protein
MRRDEVEAHRAMLDHLIAVERLVTDVHSDEPARRAEPGRRGRTGRS